MYNFFIKFINASLIPVMVLNIGAAIVGGIWLLILGEWRLVLLGVIVAAVMPWIYSLLMIVTMPFMSLIVHLQEKRKKFLFILVGWINMLITHAVHFFYVLAIFLLAVNYGVDNPMPYLLLGWMVAVGPFQYMARAESSNSLGTFMGMYLVQISYLAFCLFYYLNVYMLSFPIIILLTLVTEVFLLKYISVMFDEETKIAVSNED